jgi:hypothetical protein
MKDYFLKSFFILIFFGATGLIAQSPEQIQQSLKERLPTIDSLKLEGQIGENNSG